MSELISGKEALIALANGEEVEYRVKNGTWVLVNDDWKIREFDQGHYEFHLKPRTITINNMEVPAPFDPKFKDGFYYLDGAHAEGFSWRKMHDDTPPWFFENPVWRTEEEIKQVVAALRSIFK